MGQILANLTKIMQNQPTEPQQTKADNKQKIKKELWPDILTKDKTPLGSTRSTKKI